MEKENKTKNYKSLNEVIGYNEPKPTQKELVEKMFIEHRDTNYKKPTTLNEVLLN